MQEQDKFSSDILNLEKLLVQEFRLLQKLVEITQKERSVLLSGGEAVLQLTEDKEVLLDQLGILNDSRRKVTEDLAVALKITKDYCSVKELLPYLDQDTATRINRMAEGISNLVVQARELNMSNYTLANVKIDLLKATQAFLINLAQPEVDYRPSGTLPVSRETTSWGVERRA